MNKTKIKGNWNVRKGKLKQKFAFILKNDFLFEAGRNDEMLGKIQIKLGETKQEMHRIINRM